MIYFALCTAIACLAAHYMRRMHFRAAGAGVIWGVSMSGGLLAGSMLAIGLMSATGMAPQQSALPAMFGQAFWWSLLGTAIGYFTVNLPTKAIGIAVGIGCAALLMLGTVYTRSTDHQFDPTDRRAPMSSPGTSSNRSAGKDDTFDPSRAVPLSTYQEMKKAGDDFNPARAVPLRN